MPTATLTPSIPTQLAAILARLNALASTQRRDEMLPRYGILAKNALGVAMADINTLAKEHRKNHPLAEALWDTGVYEARLLAAKVDDPAQVTPAQMDRWCRDFENWADCDTTCFCLFDRTDHAFAKVKQWSTAKDEFVKRAAFALLASIAQHNKKAPDQPFLACLPLIERASGDNRNFVKKGVNWALRGIGERNPVLFAAAMTLARKLAASDIASARWIGKDAARELEKRADRIAKKAPKTPAQKAMPKKAASKKAVKKPA